MSQAHAGGVPPRFSLSATPGPPPVTTGFAKFARPPKLTPIAVRFPEFTRLSPNRDRTPPHEQLGVLFHHSIHSFDETIALMARPASRVSYHGLIAPDGTRCTLVPDGEIAWHAGASNFLGRTRCNDFLLGVAFAGDTYATPLSAAQLASALEWLGPRWARHGWTLDRVTDHRQVAPGRKDDLNPAEWLRLFAAITARFAPGVV